MCRLSLIFLITSFQLFGQQSNLPEVNTNLIWDLISSNGNYFKDYLKNPVKYEVQIIYSQISRDEKNFPFFTTYLYNANPEEYFYPASTVKLPAAILALEKLNELNISGLNKYTPLKIDSTENWQTSALNDSTSSNGMPSIAHYIKKIFLVSDNDAFNRLYEFLGQDYLNEKLWGKGLKDCRLISRLDISLTPKKNACTNSITFYNDEKVVYYQPQVCNDKQYPNGLSTTKRGIGFYRNDSLINEPKDFSNSNYISLADLHGIIKRVIFPETFSESERFNLTEEDYKFIYKYMSMFPRENQFPKYNSSEYWDSYVKFFMFGDAKDSLNGDIRIFNKVGEAYGYLIDNAYVIDFKNNIEFLLSAVIYVNEDQIFNDDKYEYDQIGFPFLSNLGKVIYDHELKRKRKFEPDLSKFRFDYYAEE
jgi:hypothetical protein